MLSPRGATNSRDSYVPLVFGAVTAWAHLHELRIELAEDFDQVGLRGHDGVDVLIDTRHLIEAGAEELNGRARRAASSSRPR